MVDLMRNQPWQMMRNKKIHTLHVNNISLLMPPLALASLVVAPLGIHVQ